MGSEEISVTGQDALKIADALTTTTMRILQVLWDEHLDVSTIARRLGLSEAYISEQVRLLEDLKLISASYERGKRGIRKICQSVVKRITIIIKS